MRVPVRSTARVVFGFGAVLFTLMVANSLRIDAMTNSDLAEGQISGGVAASLFVAAAYVGGRLALGYPKLELVHGTLTAHGLIDPRKRTLILSEYGAATILLAIRQTKWNARNYSIALRHLATNKVVVLPMYMFSGGDKMANSLVAELNEIRGLEPEAIDPDAMRISAEKDGALLAAGFLILPLFVVLLIVVFRS